MSRHIGELRVKHGLSDSSGLGSTSALMSEPYIRSQTRASA